jgi:hypothetical protein
MSRGRQLICPSQANRLSRAPAGAFAERESGISTHTQAAFFYPSPSDSAHQAPRQSFLPLQIDPIQKRLLRFCNPVGAVQGPFFLEAPIQMFPDMTVHNVKACRLRLSRKPDCDAGQTRRTLRRYPHSASADSRGICAFPNRRRPEWLHELNLKPALIFRFLQQFPAPILRDRRQRQSDLQDLCFNLR